jgi:hypothetical protein
MNDKSFLIITSIASPDNKVLNVFANECFSKNVGFIVVGDKKSPSDFKLNRCDFYGIERQRDLPFALAKSLPIQKYSRKNIGYLVAIAQGAEIIIETDDDNFPVYDFWNKRVCDVHAFPLINKGWVNVYRLFSKKNIWPRGFALEHINNSQFDINSKKELLHCPIQQGLADCNPDVDAIFRLTSEISVVFDKFDNIALGSGSWCPFNSQNTTWFRKAFPLMYLPSYCSFRMTDIWRSFIAQRIAWINNWHILFHNATVYQERNEHDFMLDFKDELPGYLNNGRICRELQKLDLKPGAEYLFENMVKCYNVFIDLRLILPEERKLLYNWIEDCGKLTYSGNAPYVCQTGY